MIELDIYTDCSGNKKSKDFGYSAVFKHEGKEYFHSYSVTQSQLKEILGCEEDVSNPTVEVFALVEILGKFRYCLEKLSRKEKLKLRLKVYSDYRGVSCWFNKEWAINKKYIRVLVRLARRSAEILKIDYGIETEVVWIKGHNGDEGNERADKLAGQRLNQSNIEEFFNNLKIEHLC